MTRQHEALLSRFHSFPRHQQLLMALNEINRAKNLTSNPTESKRALELLDMLTMDPRWRPALRELRRGRQCMAECYITGDYTSLPMLIRTFVQLDPTAWKLLYPAK